MKYIVNQNCIGCGVCEGVCPEVFSMNSQGLAEAIDEDVAPSDEEAAAEAMESCPVDAIEEDGESSAV